MKSTFRGVLVLVLVFAINVQHAVAEFAAAERPNIVIIMVDDMGFSDIGCYGSEIPTPHIDQLAQNGIRWTQFYNTGRCCPTRASLLTGLYSHQAGIGHMTGDYGVPGYRGFLNDRCVTIADVARSAGYFTAISGKWHVGSHDRAMWPLARGFDRFYGIPEGGGFYFQVKKGRSIVLNNDVLADVEHPLPEGWYSTDAWTDYGLKFVDEAQSAQRPFLLYVAHNAPHFPLQASREAIARFRGKYRAGWDQIGEERYQRQLAMGLIDDNWKRSPRESRISPWTGLEQQERDRLDHVMAAYAACVHSMDQSVGRLVEGLRERGAFDNTLILFLSDNGGCAEGGIRGKSPGDPTTAESNWYCGKSWAWMQDTPFRKYKHYNHEGGIATPLIAHWPSGIQETGGYCRQPGHVIDLMATVLDATGAEYPKRVDGRPILPPEGISLMPALRGESLSRTEPLFWEHEGNAAIRDGDWKLVRSGGRGNWELYDLSLDRTELNDLASEYPDRVKTLASRWRQWAQRCGVNPNGLPKKKKNPKIE